MARIRAAGLDTVRFAWMGATTAAPGAAHYYRIQGPTFLIEYDNTQNNANHQHIVWRDFNGDFGTDLLAEHYAADAVHKASIARGGGMTSFSRRALAGCLGCPDPRRCCRRGPGRARDPRELGAWPDVGAAAAGAGECRNR